MGRGLAGHGGSRCAEGGSRPAPSADGNRGAARVRGVCRPWASDVVCLVCGLLLVLAAPGLVAQARGGDRPFTIAAMLHMATPQDLTLSRNGGLAAFAVSGIVDGPDGEATASRIYLADTAAGLAKPITSSREQCEKPRFCPDASCLAYLVDEDDGADVVVMRLPSGRPRRLTRGLGDVVDLAFAPDGKSLAVTVNRALPSPQCSPPASGCDVEVLGGGQDDAAALVLVSVEHPGILRPLVTNGDVGDFVFSPDGTRIAYEITTRDAAGKGRHRGSGKGSGAPRDAAQSDIALIDLRTRAVTRLAASEASETSPHFSPDGRWLAYVATAAPGFYFNAGRVMVVPASGGVARPLAETPNARPEVLGWSARGDAVYVREARGTGAGLWALPADGSPARPLSETPHLVSQAGLSADGTTLALVLEDSDMPPEVWATPARHFAPRQLSDVNKEFSAYRLARTEVVRWTARDGTVLEGLYTHPVAPAPGAPALLVEVHGGPALVADRQCLGSLNYYPLAVFAERGYAIFRPNVRGSDGYGPAFRMAIRGDWGGLDYQDLLSGLEALVSRGLADPDRLGIMGWSYGGYLTAWAIGHGHQFKAASIGAGITDLVSQAGSMDLPDFIPLYFDGETWQRFDLLHDRSPLKYADAIDTPTLFQHGLEDERVPFTQSMELYTALSRRGVPTCLAAYPRSSHDVTEPALLRDVMRRNLEWFARYLPPTPPGPSDAARQIHAGS